MERGLKRRGMRFATVQVAIHSDHTEDHGVGIVVVKRPMTLLVPLHLITALEEDPTAQLRVNGSVFEKAALLVSPELQRDELALIRVRGRRRGPIGSIRIPRREVRLRPGQKVALGCAHSSDHPVRLGSIVEVRERTHGTTVVTDIEVRPGDSGSAVIANRQLVAVCQGMLPNGDGGVAIAMPLSTSALERLRGLRRQSFLHQGLPVFAALLLTAALICLGAITSDLFRADSVSEKTDPQIIQSWGAASTPLPMWPRLFVSSVEGARAESEATYARLAETEWADDPLPALEWETAVENPVALSYSLDHPRGGGANGLILVLSASAPMDVRVWATWEGEYCGSAHRSLEFKEPLRVYPIPTSFVLAYTGFTNEARDMCSGPHKKPNWDRFAGLTLWPEAQAGQIRFHRIELLTLSESRALTSGEGADQD